jgi:hypothetical protein
MQLEKSLIIRMQKSHYACLKAQEIPAGGVDTGSQEGGGCLPQLDLVLQ